MVLLLAQRYQQLTQVYQPGLGRLVGPRQREALAETAASGWPWAADNDAFSSWHEGDYVRMLDELASTARTCEFVTVPDIVGDHSATLRAFLRWRPEVSTRGLPVAFVLQDGASSGGVPWSDIDAAFIGGTDAFKLGPDARALAAEAKRLGLWLHMGRVNSLKRMRYARALNCDSVDGTCFSRWYRTHLPNGVRWLATANQQQHFNFEEAPT